MAQIVNNFIKGRMNKDLDDRLIPNGEYRNALNAQVSKSEGSNVGALENALGNTLISEANFVALTGKTNLKSIGILTDETSNSIFVFLSDNTSESYTPTGNGSNHYIYQYNTLTNTASQLIYGNFLNFSQLYPITGVNLIEELLFFTDNRNQPRKINITSAISNQQGAAAKPFYSNEDQISVAKYNPFQPIDLWRESPDTADGYETTMYDVSSKFYPDGGAATLDVAVNVGDTSFFVTLLSIDNDIADGVTIAYIDPNSGALIPITSATVGSYDSVTGEVAVAGVTMPALTINTEIVFSYNYYYEPAYNGDPDFLKEKFVRFSYRYRFSDGEYSIFAPFTQAAFIPKQDGYFMYNVETAPPMNVEDEQDAFRSTIVEFMENKVTKILLNIPLPNTVSNIRPLLLISSIDILYKESDSLAVKVLDTVSVDSMSNSFSTARVNLIGGVTGTVIPVDSVSGTPAVGAIVSGTGVVNRPTVIEFNAATNQLTISSTQTLDNDTFLSFGEANFFTYEYQSKKPYKTLPANELIRVYDKVPVKALAQEIISNRIVYGNFQDKHTPPASLNYNVAASEKLDFSLNTADGLVTNGSYPSGTTVLTLAPRLGTILVGDIVSGTGISSGTQVQLFTNNTTITLTKATISTLNNNDVLEFEPGGKTLNATSKIEYPNSSLKTNRSYQVGVVLSDRYGRQSTVILSSGTDVVSVNDENFLGSTVFSPYISASTNQLTWPGNSLKVLFNDPISSGAQLNSPGLYNNNTGSADYNPLGWYSYKIVVKQQEQEYYNVYLPGVMAAYPTETSLELNKTSHAVLINDNINKVPRDLSEVGPTQRQFRSSVVLNGRVENNTGTDAGSWNNQYYPGTTNQVVSTIAGNNDLFNAENAASYIPSAEFYNIDSNPLIARISNVNKFGIPATVISATNSSAITNSATINALANNVGTVLVGMSVSGFELPSGLKVLTVVSPSEITVSENISLPINTVLIFTPSVQDESVQKLAILETDGVESLLDIFWETTSTGLVNELNDAILDSTTSSSVLSNWNPTGFGEEDGIGSNVSVTNFQLVDNFGTAVPYVAQSPAQLQLHQVTDVAGNNRESDFTWVDNSNGTYNIITATTFYFSYENATNDTFNFIFEANVNGVQTFIPQNNVSLENYPPTLSGCPADFTWTTNHVGNLADLEGINGSASSTEAGLDLEFDLVVTDSSGASYGPSTGMSVPGNGSFTIDTSPGTNKMLAVINFADGVIVDDGVYTFVINLLDAGNDDGNSPCEFVMTVNNAGCCAWQGFLPLLPYATDVFFNFTNCQGEAVSLAYPFGLQGTTTFLCSLGAPTITYNLNGIPETNTTAFVGPLCGPYNTPQGPPNCN
tara:strand:+ start:2167 stop:6231 length:4065 start_codon:yes stop_codon:yes gene_type:complete